MTLKEQKQDAAKSAMRQFTDEWCARFQEFHGVPYVFQGAKDGSAAARLIKCGVGPAEIIALALEAWKRGHLFWCRQAITIAGLASRFNEIRSELNNESSNSGRGYRNKPDRNAGTANFGRAADYKGVGKLRP